MPCIATYILGFVRLPRPELATTKLCARVRESLGFRPPEVVYLVYLDNPRQMEYMWQVAFPELAKPLPLVGDTARPVSLVGDLSLPLPVKTRIMQFHK
jgi:hypothetical protein